MKNICPLCLNNEIEFWVEDKRRSYLRCQKCCLIFVEKQYHLPKEQEKAIYDQHENDVNDLGYRRFLSRIYHPILEKFEKKEKQDLYGLDFGCGPGPALAQMFFEAGINMSVFDPYFAANESVLERQYDFVTCTEAIEHFYQPFKEWQLLVSLVKEEGFLGIMTKLARDAEAFKQWHYKNDLTHVCFFSKETFLFLAKRDGLDVEFVADDVILFTKQKRKL